MQLKLRNLPAFIINLDRSHDRWIRSFRALALLLSRDKLERVSGVDGRDFFRRPSFEKAERAWIPEVRERLQSEGLLGKETLLDPVRTALCLSHQRVLHLGLERLRTNSDPSAQGWFLVFEDDARPGEALVTLESEDFEISVPNDAEVLFFHDRVWRRGGSENDLSKESENWRIVRGGIGLEAYAVNRSGAAKMLQAFRPVIEECDVQLMTFMEGYADLELKQEIWSDLEKNGHHDFPSIRAYAPTRPFFQTDHWIPSVKFKTMEEADRKAEQGGKPREPKRAEPEA